MRVLATVLIIIIKLMCWSNSTTPPHVDHVCMGGSTAEKAGRSSGSLSFDGRYCEFTLTNITQLSYFNTVIKGKSYQMNILNIVGVSKSQNCDSTHILIDSESYCVDNTVKDALVNVTDEQMKFSVVSNQAKSFTLEYYKGKQKS